MYMYDLLREFADNMEKCQRTNHCQNYKKEFEQVKENWKNYIREYQCFNAPEFEDRGRGILSFCHFV